MIGLEKLLTELLSGIAQYKPNTKEIYTKNKYGIPITVEILDANTEAYIVRNYYDNGQLEYRFKYLNGKEHGTWKSWDENGKLWFQEEYRNGKSHGTWKVWHENGKLLYQNEYQNGKLHGTRKAWDKNGQLWHHKEYKNGKPIE